LAAERLGPLLVLRRVLAVLGLEGDDRTLGAEDRLGLLGRLCLNVIERSLVRQEPREDRAQEVGLARARLAEDGDAGPQVERRQAHLAPRLVASDERSDRTQESGRSAARAGLRLTGGRAGGRCD